MEGAYFGIILLLTSLLNISLSIAIVQIIGVLIAIGYMIIVNPWLKEYGRTLDYRISKIEQEQSKIKKRLGNLEKVIK